MSGSLVTRSMRRAPFGIAVSVVRNLVADKQVGRVDAWRIVALMKDVPPLRNGAVVNVPRKAMSVPLGVPIGSHPVPPRRYVALPLPAPMEASTVNPVPKVFNRVHALSITQGRRVL